MRQFFHLGQAERLEQGAIKVPLEVLATVVGLAAGEIPGVAKVGTGIVEKIAEKLGLKSRPRQGVKIKMRENGVDVDLSIVVNYGVNIAQVAGRVQENVKKALRDMLDLSPVSINVKIQGVQFPQGKKDE